MVGMRNGSNQLNKLKVFTMWNIFPWNGEGGVNPGGREAAAGKESHQSPKRRIISAQILDAAQVMKFWFFSP